jgi:hypothetical protein
VFFTGAEQGGVTRYASLIEKIKFNVEKAPSGSSKFCSEKWLSSVINFLPFFTKKTSKILLIWNYFIHRSCSVIKSVNKCLKTYRWSKKDMKVFKNSKQYPIFSLGKHPVDIRSGTRYSLDSFMFAFGCQKADA